MNEMIEVEAWSCSGRCSHEYCGMGSTLVETIDEALDRCESARKAGATTIAVTYNDTMWTYDLTARTLKREEGK